MRELENEWLTIYHTGTSIDAAATAMIQTIFEICKRINTLSSLRDTLKLDYSAAATAYADANRYCESEIGICDVLAAAEIRANSHARRCDDDADTDDDYTRLP